MLVDILTLPLIRQPCGDSFGDYPSFRSYVPLDLSVLGIAQNCFHLACAVF